MKKKHKKTCHLCHKQFKTEAETSLHVSQGYHIRFTIVVYLDVRFQVLTVVGKQILEKNPNNQIGYFNPSSLCCLQST